MNSDDFHHFFQSNKVDFQKAVQPSVEKTGQSFSSSSFSFASIPLLPPSYFHNGREAKRFAKTTENICQ